MSGTYRHGRTYCQVAGCHARARQVGEIDLPMAWEASGEYTALTVVVGLCARHGHDVRRRVNALLEARADLPNLLQVIEDAALRDLDEAEAAVEQAQAGVTVAESRLVVAARRLLDTVDGSAADGGRVA